MTEQDAAVQTADDQPTPENGIVAEPVPAEASADTEAETPEGAATEDDASEEGSGDEASDEEGAEASERRMSRPLTIDRPVIAALSANDFTL